jgi:integrase
MFLSKRSNGYYYLHYRDDQGRWRKVSTQSTSKIDANRFLADFDLRTRNKAPHITISQFYETYLAYSKTNHSPATTKRVVQAFSLFKRCIGDKILQTVTVFDVEAFKAYRLPTCSPVTVNIDLRMLKAMFSAGVKWDIIERNPFKKAGLLRILEQAPVYLRQEEMRKLLGVIAIDWLKDVIVFAANTGLRRGEVINLKWDAVDLDRKLIYVRNSASFRTKSGKERIVPMNRTVESLLRKVPRKCECVFTGRQGTKIDATYLSHYFREAIIDAELDGRLHFHSLRHTFASWLVQNGAGIYEVQRLLGHSTIQVTQVYSHLQPEQLHSTVNRIVLNLN